MYGHLLPESRRSVLGLLATLLIALPVTIGAGSAIAQTQLPQKLVIGHIYGPDWAQVSVAEAMGAFKAEGLELKLVPFPTGVQSLAALSAGAVDISVSGDFPASSAIAKDSRIRIIAEGSRWKGASIVARRGAGISAFADLAGKKVGLPLGSTANYFAASALGASNVKARLVNARASEAIAAIATGEVDAVALFQPEKEKALKALGADAIEFPNTSYVQHSLYLALDDTIKSKGESVTAFIRAIKQADQPLASGSPQAITIVAKAMGLDEEVMKKVFREFEYKTELSPTLADDLEKLAAWARENKLVAGDTKPDFKSATATGPMQAANR